MIAFDQIDAACTSRAWALACALTGNAADADDVLQQAFIVAWRRVKDIPAEPWPWMAAVVANCARNHGRSRARKRKREAALVSAAPAQYTEPASSLEKQELQAMLSKALEELPDAEREAIVLCHISGLTQQQASEATGVNLGTLKARSSRGMARLREKLAASAAAIEGYLASVAFAPPPGGLEAAASRWKEVAVASPRPTPFGSPYAALAGAGTAIGVCLVILIVWMMSGGVAAAKHNFAAPSSLENPSVAASAPADSTPVDNALPRADMNDEVAARGPVDLTPLPAPEPAGDSADSAIPDAPELGQSPRLVSRIAYHDTGEKWMQWTELIMPGGEAWLHGALTQFYRSGGVEESFQFVRNRLHGPSIRYYESGGIQRRVDWVDGVQHGLCQQFDESGAKTAEYTYEHGSREGQCTKWHPNGQLHKVFVFRNDRAEGVEVEYDTQGNKRREVTWKAGRRDGPQREFDEYGNLVATTINVPQSKPAADGPAPKD